LFVCVLYLLSELIDLSSFALIFFESDTSMVLFRFVEQVLEFRDLDERFSLEIKLIEEEEAERTIFEVCWMYLWASWRVLFRVDADEAFVVALELVELVDDAEEYVEYEEEDVGIIGEVKSKFKSTWMRAVPFGEELLLLFNLFAFVVSFRDE
jgi:hypothetical protein